MHVRGARLALRSSPLDICSSVPASRHGVATFHFSHSEREDVRRHPPRDRIQMCAPIGFFQTLTARCIRECEPALRPRAACRAPLPADFHSKHWLPQLGWQTMVVPAFSIPMISCAFLWLPVRWLLQPSILECRWFAPMRASIRHALVLG